MMRLQSIVLSSLAALLALAAIAAPANAQMYCPGHTGYGAGAYYYPPCPPYLPYGAWPGYGPHHYGAGVGHSYGYQGGNYRASSSTFSANYRTDAYTPDVLAKYNLPPDQYVPYNPNPVRAAFYQPTTATTTGANGIATASFNATTNAAARIEIRVPTANAKIWVQGVQTTSTGLVRNFVSPPLGSQGPYRYNIQASWVVNGQTITQDRTVMVNPGDNRVVIFGS